jgi:hypothetical protein
MFYPVPSIPNYIYTLSKTFPIDSSIIYSKLENAIPSLQAVLYDAATNLLGKGNFLYQMNASSLNSVTPIIPCQNLNPNTISPNIFHVEGKSLNNSTWRDTISFKVFNCTNTLPKKVCKDNTNLIYCKNYSICVPIPGCDLKDPIWQQSHGCKDDPSKCPQYSCREGGGVEHGEMVCPEECAHNCDAGLYMDANCKQPYSQ